jgi:hypothetical protein
MGGKRKGKKINKSDKKLTRYIRQSDPKRKERKKEPSAFQPQVCADAADLLV